MRAMILAAGRGERMGELTRDVPKPLLQVAGRYLIEYPLLALAKLGISDIVINICYRGEQIKTALGNGERYGVTLHYSEEETALETGGGIYQALPLLGENPFIVLSGDVITDFPLQRLPVEPTGLAHLVLVNNPLFHPQGDFCLEDKQIYYGKKETLTFANIGVYHPALFADCQPGRFRLGEILKKAVLAHQVTGEHYLGQWHNVGSAQELIVANTQVSA
jgi:MurNAc alpha-1-phosphate uridylyltransferase